MNRPHTAQYLFDLPTGDSQPIHSCTGLGCGFCERVAERAAAASIAQAVEHADSDWLGHAEALIRRNARLGIDFTTDEVMEEDRKSTRLNSSHT